MRTTELFPQHVVPVVVLEDVAQADDLAEALIGGGLPVAEVTFRVPGAEKVIATMAQHDMLVGAGTVVTTAQVDQAVEAGARFIVSPGLSPDLVRAAQAAGLPVFPGVLTPTEIIQALDLGLTELKFFPAGDFGGPKTIKSYASPFGGVTFMPTGGVSTSNLGDYLSLPNVNAVGGTWMVSPTLLRDGDFETVRRLSSEAVAAAAEFTR